MKKLLIMRAIIISFTELLETVDKESVSVSPGRPIVNPVKVYSALLIKCFISYEYEVILLLFTSKTSFLPHFIDRFY